MSNFNLNELIRWRNDNGDQTHNLNYPLNSDSIVIDLGGFKGVWASQIIDLYNPNVYIIEPINEFYSCLVKKFLSNNKVSILNVGVSTEDEESTIYVNNDSSSSTFPGTPTTAKFMTLKNILDNWKINQVDLIQINIEGDEYPLLEQLVTTSETLNKFKYIQIQFHTGIENDIKRREFIHKELSNNGFKIRFNYPFVWEGWEKII